MIDTETIAHRLTNDHALVDRDVVLDLDGYRIAIRSNSRSLLARFERYFAHVVSGGPADIEVVAIDAPMIDLDVTFKDWKREPGKSGRKDAYHDLSNGRLVLKIRTGVVFLQSPSHRIAYGPCLDHDNQVINFINSQYMNWLQQNGALICHASGLVFDESCLCIAGFSGGGKSTLMLQLLDDLGANFLTNDRLFLETNDGGGVEAVGIPKMPRVNPGTIVSTPTLRPILGEVECNRFRELPQEELWNLEEKSDVDIRSLYGAERITPRAPLTDCLILNWTRESRDPCTISQVQLDARPELLAALMKSPGPFYQFRGGTFYKDDMEPSAAAYLESLEGVTVWEMRGRVDFQAAAGHCRTIMRAKSCTDNC